jgi:tetratricopeptide (TPR) repeat protein
VTLLAVDSVAIVQDSALIPSSCFIVIVTFTAARRDDMNVHRKLATVLTLGLLPLVLSARGEAPKPPDAGPADCPALATRAEEKAKARQFAEAAALWERVIELNPVNADYQARLARTLYDAKEYRKSIAAHEKALELRAGYPWSAAYDIACCYALLGEKEPALKWLEKSFALGFRSLDHARKDEDLVSLHDDARFRDLVAMVDTAKMSRADGWRYDLQLLVRELKRVHFDLSKKGPPPGFDAFAQKLHDDIPGLTDRQIQVAFMKLGAMAGDGHTRVSAHAFRDPQTKALPVEFYAFEEGLFIRSAAPAHKDLAGAQVLRFGEHPVEVVSRALDPVISRDNAIWIKHVGPRLMRDPQILNGLGLIPEDDKVTLTLRDASGTERVVTLVASPGQPAADWVDAGAAVGAEPLYLKNRMANYWFEFLPDTKTVYFQYNHVLNGKDESLEKFCARLFEFIGKNDVDRLVIDLRWNDGGNNFLNRPLLQGLIRCDKINQRGKLFVIAGRNTFSAAQCGATQIERYTEAIFVGEPTGSCPNFVGETVRLDLPYSKMVASISDLYWQNSVAMDYRTWIGPQIYTPPTFAAYRAKRDPAMEAILAYAKQ